MAGKTSGRTKPKTITPGEEARRLRSRRLQGLRQAIKAYDSNFDFQKFEDALEWAEQRFESPKTPTINDMFSDPLLIAEELVNYKADGDELLAAVLYPAVRPLEDHGIDNVGMKQIGDRFGEKVLNIVKLTLSVRAQELLPLDPDATQTAEEQLNLYKLLVIWAAKQPAPIRIRCVQYLVNLRTFHETGSALTRRRKDRLIWEADNIMAPIAYAVGLGKLAYDIYNASYLLNKPAEYTKTRMEIDHSGGSKITDENLDEVKTAITRFIERDCGIGSAFFTVEVRKKSAWSARRKAEDKDKTIAQLGDRYGFRVILKVEGQPDLNVNTLDEGEREMLLKKMGDLDHKVYGRLSRHFGLGSQDPVIRSAYDALIDRYIIRSASAKQDSQLRIKNLQTIKVGDDFIVVSRDCELLLLDEGGKVKQTHQIPYGAKLLAKDGELLVKDGVMVKKQQVLAEWDPYKLPIIAEHDGIVNFADLVAGISIRKSGDAAADKQPSRVVNTRPQRHKTDLNPRIILRDDKGVPINLHNGQEHYALPRDYVLNVRDGDRVKAGAILACQIVRPDPLYDNYINKPKEGGYSAEQGSFIMRCGNKLIEMEGQVVDIIRHDINTYGPRSGHVYYKTGLAKHGGMMVDWYRAAPLVMEGKEPETEYVFIWDDKNQLVPAQRGVTIEDFLKQTNPQDLPNIVGALIDNDDASAGRDDPDTSYGIFERLKNGDRVRPQFKSEFNDSLDI